MTEVNSLERYNAVLAGQPADFLPRIPILMQFAALAIEAPYGAFCSDFRVKMHGNIRCAEEFGLDVVGVMSDPYCETEAFGAEIEFLDVGVPRCPHPPLASTKDLSVLRRPDPEISTRLFNTCATVRAYHAAVGGKYTILGWVEGPAAEAADLRGVSRFLLDLIDDPGFAEELMDRCVDVGIKYARAQVEAGADTVGIGDAIASQISPRMYGELVQPREKRLAAAIREMGARVRLHICGNITHLLPAIAKLPIDILDVDHMVDMTAARAAMGRTVALSGNLDPVEGVLHGDPESIRRAMRSIYEAVGNPYLVNAGCEIPPETPGANLRALCEPIPWTA